MRLWFVLVVFAVFAVVAVQSDSPLRSDGNINVLVNNQFIQDLSFVYHDKELAEMAKDNPSVYPGPYTLSDPTLKQQIRKNILVIVDKMQSILKSLSSLAAWQINLQQTLAQIQSNYENDAIFNSRPIPAIYHRFEADEAAINSMLQQMAGIGGEFTTSTHLIQCNMLMAYGQEVLQGKKIYYADWFDAQSGYENQLLTRGVSDKSAPVIFNGTSTKLISWTLDPYIAPDVLKHVASFPQAQRDFLMSRYVSQDYIGMEHLVISLARAYSPDRANVLYDNALLRLPFTWNVQPTRTPVVGVYIGNYEQESSSYFLYGVMVNSTHYLAVDGMRQTALVPVQASFLPLPLLLFVPDRAMNDGMMLVQWMADGALLQEQPASYKNFLASVDKITKKL